MSMLGIIWWNQAILENNVTTLIGYFIIILASGTMKDFKKYTKMQSISKFLYRLGYVAILIEIYIQMIKKCLKHQGKTAVAH